MATSDTIVSFCELSVFLIFTYVVSTQAAQFCHYGTDVSDQNALRNQTCSTGDVHLSRSLFVTDHRNTSSYSDEEYLPTDERDSVQDHFCFISRVISTKFFESGVKKESVQTAYGCDTSNLCQNRKLGTILYNITVNGQTGQLYCCSSENCNLMDKLPHPSAENRICLNGNNSASETPSIELKSCNHPDVMCVRSTTFLQDRKLQSYSCDDEKVCQSQMMNGAFKSCQNTTTAENVTQEMCCCDGLSCFNPPWKIVSHGSQDSDDSSKKYPSKNSINKPPGEESDKLVVTGLVAALVLIVSIGSGIIFVIACKRRKRPQRDPNVIMQYEKLSASDPEDAVIL